MEQKLSSAEITKASGSNLALSFVSLPKDRQEAMSVFYAFCRIADDIVDEQPHGREHAANEIRLWREEIKACYEKRPTTPLGIELAGIIHRYNIPSQYFFDILDGVEMDLNASRYETFEDLSKYCYRVASAVGLVSIYIFGCKHPQAHEYAIALGMAFQLTNILRDVKQDLQQYGRVYLPRQEMITYGVTEDDLREGRFTESCDKLFRMQYFRAKHYFNKARRLLPLEDYEHLAAAIMMTAVYGDILEKIRKKQFNVLGKSLKLSKFEKILALSRARKWIKNKPAPVLPPSRVAVWGGGFAGISASFHLAMEGHQVDLYEAKPFWGGRAHSFSETRTGLELDNGQHILMGCYRSCLELLHLLGNENKLLKQKSLSLDFVSPKMGVTRLFTPNIPSPFHLLFSVLTFAELKLGDRFAILNMGFRLRLGCKPNPGTSVDDWLRSWGQTPGAIRSLWEPLCIAALNEHVSSADALLFYEVLSRSLFGSKEASAIYLSKVGLSELFMPETQRYLESVGGKTHLGIGVKQIQFAGTKIESFTTSKGETIRSDYYISTLPPSALATLIPQDYSLHKQIRNLSSSPIINVHIWTDRPITNKPITGFLDSPIHWLFDRNPYYENKDKDSHIYAVVISAAYNLASKKSSEIIDMIVEEIKKNIPSAESFEIKHSLVYKSLDATFASRPGCEAYRPGTTTEFENLFLAGDWTDTKLPGTLESATLSGAILPQAMDSSLVGTR